MSLADLRKELKDLRKSANPVPASRMKKAAIATEIAQLKGLHHGEVKKVAETLKEAEVPKKVAKKVAAVQEKEHAKQEESVKKTKGVKAAKEEVKPKAKETKSDKPAKGSEEMRARMAALRAKRSAKKDE